MAFSTKNLKAMSWCDKKGVDDYVLKWDKVGQSSAICALTDEGRVYGKMRVGTNDATCFLQFLEELEMNIQADMFGYGQKSEMAFKEYWS